MSAHSIRNQYRHYRTLIVLVLAMTAGTLLLVWLGRFSPVTPLRSTVATTSPWTQISVRAECARSSPGFFHYRIDEAGRLFQSYAWQTGQADLSSPRTIHILLTCPDVDAKVTPEQTKMLTKLIGRIRTDYGIAAERVFVESARGVADRGQAHSRLRRT